MEGTRVLGIASTRAVHKFKALVGRKLLAVRAFHVQTTIGQVWFGRPQRVVRNCARPSADCAVVKSFAAIITM